MSNGYCLRLRAAGVAILLSITAASANAEEGAIMTLAPLEGAELVFPEGYPSELIPDAINAWNDLSVLCAECATGGTVGSAVVGRDSTARIPYSYRRSGVINGSITITMAQWEEYMLLKASCK